MSTQREIRLSAHGFDFWIDVRLYEHEERWLAVAELAGELDVGLGVSSHEACANALVSLGQRASDAFLASLPAALTS